MTDENEREAYIPLTASPEHRARLSRILSEARERLTVVSMPDQIMQPSPPTLPASTYLAGTVVQDAAGVLWQVYWDEQDHERKWQRA